MCPRMSSSWPVTFQQRSVPQSVLHPPLPHPAPGLQTEVAAGGPGLHRWKWPSAAPEVPDTKAHDVPYPELQINEEDMQWSKDTGTNILIEFKFTS